jgi:hypothetical protein
VGLPLHGLSAGAEWPDAPRGAAGVIDPLSAIADLCKQLEV